jgi:hypothetical protein
VNPTTGAPPEKLGTLPYVIGGMSFIPLLGLLFGLIAVVWGLATNKQGGKRLAAIGLGGISFTIVLYGALYYFGFKQRGGIYDDLRIRLAQTEINSLVQSIEFYRTQHGGYPESLEALKASLPSASLVSVIDPTDVRSGGHPRAFFYERVGDAHYYLRGVGPDGHPFTADDIVPQVTSMPGSKVGLLLQREPGSSP